MQNSILELHLHQGTASKTFHCADIGRKDPVVQINLMSTDKALDLHFLIFFFCHLYGAAGQNASLICLISCLFFHLLRLFTVSATKCKPRTIVRHRNKPCCSPSCFLPYDRSDVSRLFGKELKAGQHRPARALRVCEIRA